MKITLSKSQWQNIGKQAGWITNDDGYADGGTPYTASFWPLAILLFGSVIPFWEYLSALKAGDKIQMKIAVSKVKSLLFLSLVVVIIFRILGDGGVFGLRIGK